MASHSLINLSNSSVTALTPNGTHSGIDITIQNVSSSGYVYIGATSSLSSTNYGHRLMPNHSWSIELSGNDDVYATASAPDTTIAVFTANLEVGN